MTDTFHRLQILAVGIGLAVVGLACASPPAVTPPVQTMGFLDGYSQLEPGRADQARLIFIDYAVDFSVYQRVVVDRVVAWRGGETEERLAESFDTALRDELATEFKLVDGPQAGTLRLRAAVALNSPSVLGIEVELLDAVSGARVAAAVDERTIPSVDHERARVQQNAELVSWAGVVRTRLAALRSFDAAQRARSREEAR